MYIHYCISTNLMRRSLLEEGQPFPIMIGSTSDPSSLEDRFNKGWLDNNPISPRYKTRSEPLAGFDDWVLGNSWSIPDVPNLPAKLESICKQHFNKFRLHSKISLEILKKDNLRFPQLSGKNCPFNGLRQIYCVHPSTIDTLQSVDSTDANYPHSEDALEALQKHVSQLIGTLFVKGLSQGKSLVPA